MRKLTVLFAVVAASWAEAQSRTNADFNYTLSAADLPMDFVNGLSNIWSESWTESTQTFQPGDLGQGVITKSIIASDPISYPPALYIAFCGTGIELVGSVTSASIGITTEMDSSANQTATLNQGDTILFSASGLPYSFHFLSIWFTSGSCSVLQANVISAFQTYGLSSDQAPLRTETVVSESGDVNPFFGTTGDWSTQLTLGNTPTTIDYPYLQTGVINATLSFITPPNATFLFINGTGEYLDPWVGIWSDPVFPNTPPYGIWASGSRYSTPRMLFATNLYPNVLYNVTVTLRSLTSNPPKASVGVHGATFYMASDISNNETTGTIGSTPTSASSLTPTPNANPIPNPTPTPTPTPTPSHSNVGAIVGGVVGGVVAAALIGVAVWFFGCGGRKRLAERKRAADLDPSFIVDDSAPAMQVTPFSAPFQYPVTASSQDEEMSKHLSPVRRISTNDETVPILDRSVSGGGSSGESTSSAHQSWNTKAGQGPRHHESEIVEEEDAGRVEGVHFVPPRYNPHWVGQNPGSAAEGTEGSTAGDSRQ